MSHLQRNRIEGAESRPAELARPGSATDRRGRRRPLGVLLVCSRNAAWHGADPNERHPFDFDDSRVLKRWEAKVKGRIYRVYAYSDREEASWEYFTLLEFDDLTAWNRLQEEMDDAGFSAYFDWDIVAFGRSIG